MAGVTGLELAAPILAGDMGRSRTTREERLQQRARQGCLTTWGAASRSSRVKPAHPRSSSVNAELCTIAPLVDRLRFGRMQTMATATADRSSVSGCPWSRGEAQHLRIRRRVVRHARKSPSSPCQRLEIPCLGLEPGMGWGQILAIFALRADHFSATTSEVSFGFGRNHVSSRD